MIYTVTFNPAIDYVVRLDAPLEVGAVNRAQGEDCVLGGKGINVSGVLRELGCESVALGFVAGETGAWLERGLAAQGLRTSKTTCPPKSWAGPACPRRWPFRPQSWCRPEWRGSGCSCLLLVCRRAERPGVKVIGQQRPGKVLPDAEQDSGNGRGR